MREQDIAVVGLAGRFPGASSVQEFFDNCCQGKETISHFSAKEMEKVGIHPTLYSNPDYVPAKGIIEGVDLFDAAFFGLSELDAKILDPQQRLFILAAWEALLDAGVTARETPKRIGVFASTGMSTYLYQNILKNPAVLAQIDEFQLLLANDKDFLATRVSYLFNLTGPSLTIQTGCSSSLVCIHYAIQSILNGECDMALAGGVSITIPQEQGYLYRKEMIGSVDGHCYAFDERAQGTVKSNGVGVVALKPLEEALADNDKIYAIVRGSAVNNDGARKVGFTAPNAQQQAEVIKEAMMVAEVSSESIGYIETHGTGTLLGDPIEIAGLKQAFAKTNETLSRCALVALKTNIGHLDVAAGVASFIRACLALYYGKIPPSLHFSTLNPKISLENTPFYVNTSLQDWPTTSWPKRAGVSAFGVGGTNAHVVLQAHGPLSSPFKPPKAALWNLKSYWIYPENTRSLYSGKGEIPAYQEMSEVQPEGLQSQEDARQYDRLESSNNADSGQATLSPVQQEEVSAILHRAWTQVLGSPPLSQEANFFHQGGHSLAAIQLIEQLPKTLRSKVDVVHVYQFPQFNQLLQWLQSSTLEAPSKESTCGTAEIDVFSEGVEL